jgi:hypothetical protein
MELRRDNERKKQRFNKPNQSKTVSLFGGIIKLNRIELPSFPVLYVVSNE